jgi:hypothetical protein
MGPQNHGTTQDLESLLVHLLHGRGKDSPSRRKSVPAWPQVMQGTLKGLAVPWNFQRTWEQNHLDVVLFFSRRNGVESYFSYRFSSFSGYWYSYACFLFYFFYSILFSSQFWNFYIVNCSLYLIFKIHWCVIHNTFYDKKFLLHLQLCS